MQIYNEKDNAFYGELWRQARHSRIYNRASTNVCGWMQMIIIDRQLIPGKRHQQSTPRKDEEKKIKPSGTFIIQWNFSLSVEVNNVF